MSQKTFKLDTFNVQAVQGGTVYDVADYAWVSVQIASQYTGSTPTIAFQASDDGVTWFNNGLVGTAAGQVATNTTTSTGMLHGPISGRYFRLNFTGAYSSGAATGTIVFSASPRVLQNAGALQVGTWSVTATPAAAATGGYSNTPIKTATTTTVKSGAGTLHTITIAGGTAGAITVYDSTTASGTEIIPAFTPAAVTTPVTLTFDIAFATGLTIVTGAATVLAVSWK